MSWSLWAAGLLTALVAAAYLQIPTFLLAAGYGWFHRYRAKRWILRGVSTTLLGWLVLRGEGGMVLNFLAILPGMAVLVFSLLKGGQDILVSRSPATGSVHAHSLEIGEEIPVQRHWWFGWKEFHPDTEIWQGSRS